MPPGPLSEMQGSIQENPSSTATIDVFTQCWLMQIVSNDTICLKKIRKNKKHVYPYQKRDLLDGNSKGAVVPDLSTNTSKAITNNIPTQDSYMGITERNTEMSSSCVSSMCSDEMNGGTQYDSITQSWECDISYLPLVPDLRESECITPGVNTTDLVEATDTNYVVSQQGMKANTDYCGNELELDVDNKALRPGLVGCRNVEVEGLNDGPEFPEYSYRRVPRDDVDTDGPHSTAYAPKYPKYRDKTERLFSFSRWLYGSIQDATRLANYGFFHTGEGDLVRCHYCGFGLKDFIETDEPLVEHVRYGGDCPFLLEYLGPQLLDTYKRRVRTETHQAPIAHPKEAVNTEIVGASEQLLPTPPRHRHPEYRMFDLRLASFVGWPTHLLQTPQQVAEAGFYFTGKKDVVRCWWCDGCLQKWEPTDDPWVEHCKWFEFCPFLRETKGDAYINQVRVNHQVHPQQQNVTPSGQGHLPNGVTGNSQGAECVLHNQMAELNLDKHTHLVNGDVKTEEGREPQVNGVVPRKENGTVHHSRDPPGWGSAAAKAVLEMGFKESDVLGAVRRLHSKNKELSAKLIIDTIEHIVETSPPVEPKKPLKASVNTENVGTSEQLVPTPPRHRHPEYRMFDIRLASFVGWPPHLLQTPQQVAEAGFYFTGVKDVVRCWYCDGCLQKWEPTDDPWVEHCKWFEFCPFLRETKGDAYINQVRVNHQVHPQQQNVTPSGQGHLPNGVTGNSQGAECVLRNQMAELNLDKHTHLVNGDVKTEEGREPQVNGVVPKKENGMVHHSRDPPEWGSAAVKAVLEMGFKESDVLGAVRRFHSKNKELSAELIIDTIEHIVETLSPVEPKKPLKASVNTENVGTSEHLLPAPPRHRHPEYRMFDLRLASFVGWPPHLLQTPQQVAEAGFYFTGKKDVVQCWWCDGCLQKWEPTDDPWVEHCKWFEFCPFLRETKGDAYINHVRVNHQVHPQQQNVTPSGQGHLPNGVTGNSQGAECVLHNQMVELNLDKHTHLVNGDVKTEEGREPQVNGVVPRKENGTVHHSRDPPGWGSAAVKAVLEMGFKESDVLGAVRRLHSKNKELSAELIVDTIEHIVETSPQVEPEKPLKASEGIAENQQLKSFLICNGCQQRETNALFLPCQHHRYCMDCAKVMKHCPICGQSILHMVKTFAA